MSPHTPTRTLAWAFEKLALAQGTSIDALRLQSSLEHLPDAADPFALLNVVCQRMGLGDAIVLERPDRAQLPLIAHHPSLGWCVLVDTDPLGRWTALTATGTLNLAESEWLQRSAIVPLAVAPGEHPMKDDQPVQTDFQSQVRSALRQCRGPMMEAVLATCFIGLLALMTSLYSMQVYDRVIPTRSEYTLIVLTGGVALAILIELAMKYARAAIMDHVIVSVDNRLSRDIFQRLLQVRVDQLPPSVGSLAGQMRGYEQVRAFYTASTLFALVDLPLGLVFLLVIALIGTPLLAAIPLTFAVLALIIGYSARRKVDQLAKDGAALSNLKTGLLVEAVEGVETIKAGGGGWKFLSRWLNVTGQTIQTDLKMRMTSEGTNFMAATVQQLSYALLVAAGAYAVMQGHMTMGALIGCSILSGRVLAPILAMPGLLVQHAHAKAASEGLDKLYQLKTDLQDVRRPLVPAFLRGNYVLEQVQFGYGSGPSAAAVPPALVVPRLQIRAGERIAILGPIGAGKSTLLRLMTGLYLPQKGRVMMDGLDMAHISREVIHREVGYLQQDHRLFQGSLRDNLLIGMADPGDEALIAAMNRTGMIRLVSTHPQGLARPIAEGGKGLSGGQRQLLAFTRVVLTNPDVLLLDEPTATMDEEQERQCLKVLAEEASKGKTLIVVTHKPSVLPLVERLIIVNGSRIVVDGPRDEVLQKLRAQPAAAAATQPA